MRQVLHWATPSTQKQFKKQNNEKENTACTEPRVPYVIPVLSHRISSRLKTGSCLSVQELVLELRVARHLHRRLRPTGLLEPVSRCSGRHSFFKLAGRRGNNSPLPKGCFLEATCKNPSQVQSKRGTQTAGGKQQPTTRTSACPPLSLVPLTPAPHPSHHS